MPFFNSDKHHLTMLRLFYCTICCFFSIVSHSQSQWGFVENPRKKVSLNAQWKFKLGDPDARYFEIQHDHSNWQTVHLPHTLRETSLSLDENTDDKYQETFHREVGWYSKRIMLHPSNNKVFLEFEGAHQVTTLWINGREVWCTCCRWLYTISF